eukprot:SAG31_NODE_15_length_37942_cov_32.078297_26_plen_152_part_00
MSHAKRLDQAILHCPHLNALRVASKHAHRAVVAQARGFDGLYLDMLCDDYWCGANLETGLNENLTVFDINGDGVPNTLKDIQTQWKSWRPYFVAKLRGVLRADQLLIGNTAGPMSLPGIGIVLHSRMNVHSWCAFTLRVHRSNRLVGLPQA